MVLEFTVGQAAAAAAILTTTSASVAGLASWIWARSRQEAEWLTEQRARELHPLRHEVYSRIDADGRFSRHDICVIQHGALEERHRALERKIDDGFKHMEKLVREIVRHAARDREDGD